MSNQSFGTGKTDCPDMLKHMINDHIFIFHWREKRVSDNVARISIVGYEDSSLRVLTFRAAGFATTFETPPQHAEAFVVSNTLDSFMLEISKETPIYKTDRSPNNLDCILC